MISQLTANEEGVIRIRQSLEGGQVNFIVTQQKILLPHPPPSIPEAIDNDRMTGPLLVVDNVSYFK